MSGYSKNLSYIVRRIQNYSRNTFRLQTLNQTSASPSQVITVDLPSNSLCDLNSFAMFFTGSTTGACSFSRGIESIIQRVEIEANGQIISTSCSNYNQLMQMILDTSAGNDAHIRRGVMNGGTAVTAAATQTNVPFCINSWLGFLGSASPSVLDTNLIGNVRLRITLAGPECLVQATAATGGSYSLSNIYFSIDTLSIDDGVFYAMHEKFLASGGIYEIPFKNYSSFSSSGALSQSCKFSLSTGCLTRVWGCFTAGGSYGIDAINGTANSVVGGTVDRVTGAASYFTRIGSGAITWTGGSGATTYALTSYGFNVNGRYFPNFRPDGNAAFPLMLSAYGSLHDTLGGVYPGLNSITAWNTDFWCCAQKFCHDDADFMSGLDLRGSTAQGFFETVGTITGSTTGGPGANLTANVFCEMTSVLRIGAGRQLELVL